MIVLVTGSRDWVDEEFLWRVLDGHLPFEAVVEGGARGADTMAKRWAWNRGVVVAEFPAEWDRWHRAAGPKRNQLMIEQKPDLVIAFHDDLSQSRGTADMVMRALKAGVRVEQALHGSDGRTWVRVVGRRVTQ